EHANFDMRLGHPSPVGIYPLDAHEHGVRDLVGNVLEWCGDWFGAYDAAASKDPAGPQRGSSRVLRGGSFDFGALSLRAASRSRYRPEGLGGFIGFRVVWWS